MNTIKKIWDWLNNSIEILVGILFGAIIIVIAIEVIARYVLHLSMMWTEEMARYLLVLVSVIGVASVSRTGDHIGVFFIRDNLKGKTKAALYIFNIFLTILFLSVMIYATYMAYIKGYNNRGTLIRWFKTRWLYLGMGIGCIFMLIYAIRDLCHSIYAFVKNIPITSEGLSSPFPNGIDVDSEKDTQE